MRKALFCLLLLMLIPGGNVFAQMDYSGQWVLSYDEKQDGYIDPVHVHNFSISGYGNSFSGKYVGHEAKAHFQGTLYPARGVTLIQMVQSSPNFYRLYSGTKVSPTRFVGTYHGVGNGPPGWRGDWELKRLDVQHSSDNNMNYVKGFQGKWQTNWGPLTFTVNGLSVTGTYPHDNGRIEATLSADGRTMEGMWLEAPSYSPPNDGGRVIFRLSPDNKQISGHWWYGQNTEGGDWTGSRLP